MYTYIYIYIYIYRYRYIYIYAYVYIYIYIYIYAYMHTYIHIHIFTYTHTHTHIYIYIFIYIFIYIYIHTCIYIHTYTHIYILVGRGPVSSTGCVRGTAQSEPREVADGKGAAYAARVALLRAQRKVAEGRRAAEATREAAVLVRGQDVCAPKGASELFQGRRDVSLRERVPPMPKRPRLEAPPRDEPAVLVSLDEDELVREAPVNGCAKPPSCT